MRTVIYDWEMPGERRTVRIVVVVVARYVGTLVVVIEAVLYSEFFDEYCNTPRRHTGRV